MIFHSKNKSKTFCCRLILLININNLFSIFQYFSIVELKLELNMLLKKYLTFFLTNSNVNI